MSEKVLVIEDDQDTAVAVKKVLQAEKYSVLEADDPEDGFKLAKREKPDVIVLDVMFGTKEKVDGFELAVRMRRDDDLAPIPILMLTAVNARHPGFKFSPDTDGEFLPVDDFLEKPAEPKELITRIKKLVSMKTSKWKDWPRDPSE